MLGHHDYERNNLGLASRGRAMSLKLAIITVSRVGSGCWRNSDDSYGDNPMMSRKMAIN
jgi:hypothetical protein